MRKRIAARFSIASALMIGVGAGAGCSSSSSVPSGGTTRLTQVSVGVLPIIDNAPVFIALQRGLFHQQGLDVTPVVLSSGELATQELLSGKVQFAFSNYVTTIQAASGGAELQVVADGAETLPNTNVIMIAKGSPIRHVQDLRGKTIAVNARGNIGSLMIDSALATYGVPVNSVRFVVIPFPQMAAALGDHSVDAAWMAEPFVTESGEQTGAEQLADTTAGAMADFPIAGYDTLRAFGQQHPATVAAFQRAIVQAQALAADRSVVEKALPTYIDGMTPPVISAVHLDSYPTSLSQARLQRVANTMLLAGMLRQSFSVRQLLAP